MHRINLTVLPVVCALLAAPTFAQGDVTEGPLYICDEGSEATPAIQVILPSDPDSPATLLLESEAFEMAPVRVASGFGYDIVLPSGHFMVRGKGEDMVLQVDENVPAPCLRQISGAQSTSDDYISTQGNFSLGGNVRSGPGTDFPASESLSYGEPVALVSRTGVMLDGYEWFEIEYSEGLRGFQWGGIMCSNALHIIGLYEDCPAELE